MNERLHDPIMMQIKCVNERLTPLVKCTLYVLKGILPVDVMRRKCALSCFSSLYHSHYPHFLIPFEALISYQTTYDITIYIL